MFFHYPQWLGGVSDPSMTVYPPRAFNNPTRVKSPVPPSCDTASSNTTSTSPCEADGAKPKAEDSKQRFPDAGDHSEYAYPTAYAPQPPPPYVHERHKPHQVPDANIDSTQKVPRQRSKSTPPSTRHPHTTKDPPRPSTPHEYHQGQAGKRRSYKPETYEYDPFSHPTTCPGHAFVFPKSWPSKAAFDAWHAKQKLVYDLWKKGIHETHRAHGLYYTAHGWTYSQQQPHSWQAPEPPPQQPAHNNCHNKEYYYRTQAGDYPWRQQTYPGYRFPRADYVPEYTHEYAGGQGAAPPRYQSTPKPATPASTEPPPQRRRATSHRSDAPPSRSKPPKPAQTIKEAFLYYSDHWDMLIAPNNDGKKLTFFSVPWPQFPRPSSVEEINTQMIRKFLKCGDVSMKIVIRKALLRFHPDKIANLIANVEDEYKEDVADGCIAVARCLNEIKSSLS